MKPRRALAWLETYYPGDLSEMSIWNGGTELFNALNREGLTTYVEYVVPATRRQVTWPAGFFDERWARPLPIGGPLIGMDHEPVYGATLAQIAPKKGRVLVDYVLSNLYLDSAVLQQAMIVRSHRYLVDVKVPVITWYTELVRQPHLPGLTAPTGRMLLAASAVAGPVIVMNEFDRQEFYDVMAEMLTPEWQEKLECHVVNPAIDLDVIDQRRPFYERERAARRAAEGVVTLMHGGRVHPNRHLGDVAKHSLAVRESGSPVRTLFTTQQAHKTNPFEPYKVEFVSGLNRGAWLEQMGKGDILAMSSDPEVTGLVFMEAIRSGMLPLSVDRPWARARLPEGYPFVYVNWTHFEELLKVMVENHAAIRDEWGLRLIDALKPYGHEAVAHRYAEVIEAIMEPIDAENQRIASKVSPAFGILGDWLEQEGWPELQGFASAYEGMQRTSKKKLDHRWIQPLALRQMLKAHGYVDLADGPTPHMVKQ